MSRETIELLLSDEFRNGLVIGATAAATGGLLGILWRIRRATPVPAAGLLIAAAGYLALQDRVWAAGGPWEGLLLLLVSGALRRQKGRLIAVIAWLSTAVGAWLIMQAASIPDSHWAPWFGLLAIVLASPAVANADRLLAKEGLGPLLFGLSAVGVFLAVPDTEGILVLMSVCLPIAVTGWPIRLTSLGSSGAYGSMGILMWTIVAGGYGRPGSLVGATLCLGVLIVLPLAWLMDGRNPPPLPASLSLGRVLSLVATHLVSVGLASRVVAVPQSPLPAAGAALLLTFFGLGLWKWASRRRWFESGATQ